MLLERNNSNKPVPLTVNNGPPSPEFSKNFEYLIRRELDIDHSSSALYSSKIFIFRLIRKVNED